MKKLMIAAAFLATALTSGAAQAETITVTNWTWTPGFVVGDVRNFTPASPNYLALDGLGVGQFEMTGTSSLNMTVDIFSYCIDLYTSMSTGTFTYVPGSTLIPDSSRRDMLGAVLSHSSTLLAGATGNQAIQISAATQMAVWEIVYETSPSLFDVTAGNFRVGNFQASPADGNLAASQSLANTYLSNVTSGQWQTLAGYETKYLFGNHTSQSQIYTAAVPEPATWGMMVLGFGLLGGLLRRGYKTFKAQLLLLR